jgi:phosphohistidine phosphatase SixA
MTTPRAVLHLVVALLCLPAALWPTAAPTQERAPSGVPLQQEPAAAAPAELATVLLVRHAEKGDDDPRDPGLSARGTARAEALAGLLAHAGVTHLYTSEYRRTQATLAPLGARVGVAPVARPARELAQLAAELRSLPAGSVAVVAGHSNTVPALARALGVELRDLVDSPAGKVLDESIYDRVWIVTHAVGAAERAPAPRVVELTLQTP